MMKYFCDRCGYEMTQKYRDKLEEIEQCIQVMTEQPQILSYDNYIELLKLQLEVSKEIHRLELKDV